MQKAHINRAQKCHHIGSDGTYVSTTADFTWSDQRIRKIFHDMKTRCYNQNDENYRWYGAKGIKICNEWITNPKLFEDWAFANGYTANLTIDRIDENKDYSPSNCRWITGKDNAKYKSTTSLITVDGETHTGSDWSKILGFGKNRINIYVREYGVVKVVEFIRRFKDNPTLKPKHKQSYFDLYMNIDVG